MASTLSENYFYQKKKSENTRRYLKGFVDSRQYIEVELQEDVMIKRIGN